MVFGFGVPSRGFGLLGKHDVERRLPGNTILRNWQSLDGSRKEEIVSEDGEIFAPVWGSTLVERYRGTLVPW